jgi:hypothetical protein
VTDITEKSDEFLLTQLDKALVGYGQADAIGAGKRKSQMRGMISRLVKELRARGFNEGYVREIE